MKKHLISGLVGVILCILSHVVNLQGAILLAALMLCFAIIGHAEKTRTICAGSAEAPDKLEPKADV